MTFGSAGIAAGFIGQIAAVHAALVTPAWLSGNRWQRMLDPEGLPVRPTPSQSPTSALRTTERMLRLLSRVPGSPWRATCLYRCLAATLVLRRLGIPARLCLGVAEDRGVTAHAWVEDPHGTVLYERRGEFRPLA